MGDELNINAVVASFIQQNIEVLFATGKDVLKTTSNRLRLTLDRTYSNYLQRILQKYSRAKSFLIRAEPVYLYDFYVPLSVRCRKTAINNPQFADVMNFSRCTVVTGSGGSGKSMFMRHLMLNSIMARLKVPVFIELRQFNENGHDLQALIKQTLNTYKFRLDEDYVHKAIEAGHFALFLDGFDEVLQDKRQAVTKELLAFAKTYDRNIMIVSSRPDSELDGWPGFGILHLQPLTLDQALSLVTRLPYDDDLKTRFGDDLRAGLYSKHESFLSNPLLLSIMLLTYGQSANIPSKLNVFYNQAYEALFERHDALKGGYRRLRRTTLDIQDFARAFSAFCVQTYDKRRFEFAHTEALEYVEKAKQITQMVFDKNDYLKDALQAVCLLVEEGLVVVFSHRSFQEYFAARFIAEARPVVQEQLIRKYSRNIRIDSVMILLYEMRPEIVEQHFLMPGLDQLFSLIGVRKKIGITHYLRYLKEAYEHFAVRQDDVIGTHNKKSKLRIADLVSFTLWTCGNVVGWTGFTQSAETRKANMKYFWDTYSREGKEVRIPTAGLTTRDPFVHDLAEKAMFFSIETLRTVNRIRAALKERASLRERSLDDILKAE